MYCNHFSKTKIRTQINEILSEKIYPKIVETYGLPKAYYLDDEHNNISNNDLVNKKSIR